MSTMTTTYMNRRRYWARRLIDRARGAEIPSYGGIEWLMLPDDDPRKVAACVVAAEVCAADGDDIEVRLHREIDSARRAFKRAEDEDYQEAAAAAHRHRWRPVNQQSFEERRARQLEAAERQGSDYCGGPATWAGGDLA